MRNLNGQLDELKKTVSFIDVDGLTVLTGLNTGGEEEEQW